MKFKILIDSDNAAFEEDGEHEVARILNEVAESLKLGRHIGNVRDINGNIVGTYEYDNDKDEF